MLEEAHRERSRLEKHRSHLEGELSRLSAELGMDLKLTPIEVTHSSGRCLDMPVVDAHPTLGFPS